jgi:hypothetical protein
MLSEPVKWIIFLSGITLLIWLVTSYKAQIALLTIGWGGVLVGGILSIFTDGIAGYVFVTGIAGFALAELNAVLHGQGARGSDMGRAGELNDGGV